MKKAFLLDNSFDGNGNLFLLDRALEVNWDDCDDEAGTYKTRYVVASLGNYGTKEKPELRKVLFPLFPNGKVNMRTVIASVRAESGVSLFIALGLDAYFPSWKEGFWCGCEGDQLAENSYFVDDNESPICKHHHYRCCSCHGVLQVG